MEALKGCHAGRNLLVSTRCRFGSRNAPATTSASKGTTLLESDRRLVRGAKSLVRQSAVSTIRRTLDNLKAEHSIGANDTPHRLTAAFILIFRSGKGRWIGRGMNRVLDAIVGGWSLNSFPDPAIRAAVCHRLEQFPDCR